MAKDFENKGLDQAFLRKKYEEERLKRLRPEGHEGYLLPEEANFENHIFDPNCRLELLERKPVNVKSQVVIIGGGFGGLLAAVRLIQAGITDIKIVDKAGDFGGTWYWNR